MGLTSAEIAAALAFKFPAIRQMRLETSLVDVTIHCECGDHTRVIASETDNVDITCICGRTWVVPLCATPGKSPAPSDIEVEALSSEAEALPSLDETGPISVEMSLIVRAQQAVDRWKASHAPKPFSTAMAVEANSFRSQLRLGPAAQTGFLAVTEAIRYGKGQAFSNRSPLLAVLRACQEAALPDEP